MAQPGTAPAPEIGPSETSSEKDFDFLHGVWKIQNRKLKSRLTGSDEWLEFESTCECRPILHGFGNIDKFTADLENGPFEAVALRLFNPKTRLWSIYWADSNAVVLDVPQVGSFDGDTGEFLARDTWNGTPVIVKFHWDKSDRQNPKWSQAFSPDEGTTWEWNWYMTLTRDGLK
jgi:hypothetical protein